MRLFAPAAAPVVVLACSLFFTPFASAYVIKIWRDSANCTGFPIDNEPEYVNDFRSNNKCDKPGIIWDGGLSIKYQSDIGCALSVFSDKFCEEDRTVTRVQNECLTLDFRMLSSSCLDERPSEER